MLIFAYLKEMLLIIVGFFTLYLFNRNKTLKAEKEVLEKKIITNDKVIDVQNKVLDATTNVTHSDIDDSIGRLSNTNKK
jgi:hypothetical protein